MTTTGPFELSGIAAGVSVEGPIASVSARLRSGFADEVTGGRAPGAGIVTSVCGTVISAGAVVAVVVAEPCAGLLVAAGVAPDDGNVLISTGLDESSSCETSFSIRDPATACGGLPCTAVDGWSTPVEAMSADSTPSQDVSGNSDCEMTSE